MMSRSTWILALIASAYVWSTEAAPEDKCEKEKEAQTQFILEKCQLDESPLKTFAFASGSPSTVLDKVCTVDCAKATGAAFLKIKAACKDINETAEAWEKDQTYIQIACLKEGKNYCLEKQVTAFKEKQPAQPFDLIQHLNSVEYAGCSACTQYQYALNGSLIAFNEKNGLKIKENKDKSLTEKLKDCPADSLKETAELTTLKMPSLTNAALSMKGMMTAWTVGMVLMSLF